MKPHSNKKCIICKQIMQDDEVWITRTTELYQDYGFNMSGICYVGHHVKCLLGGVDEQDL